MTSKKNVWLARIFLAAFFMSVYGLAFAETAPRIELNASHPDLSTPILLKISREQSIPYHWKAGSYVRVRAFVYHANGRKEFLKDRHGHSSWKAMIDPLGRAKLNIEPSADTFSGVLYFQGNGKPLERRLMIKSIDKILKDNTRIRVRYNDQDLEKKKEVGSFALEVLDAAVSGYETITVANHFNAKGYSFSQPDRRYAYDPDQTIDIYLGEGSAAEAFQDPLLKRLSFTESPCFDAVKVADSAYQAVILLPVGYKNFIQSWERLNPSPLGVRDVRTDLRGTLIHEMLHLCVFYYNKNLSKGLDESTAPSKELDWYIEGLARYFEIFAGARHDFFSQGFKETLANKIRFSRGGANYFMRYPDQPFTRLRYENALFWRYIDFRYGMAPIEKLSRLLRGYPSDSKNATALRMQEALGVPFTDLLTHYARAVLLKDFGLDKKNLLDVAKTKLRQRDGQFYLVDGYGNERFLGAICKTDWVGQWGSARAALGEASVGGDTTEEADVSPWAMDFYEIEVSPTSHPPANIGVANLGPGHQLSVEFLCLDPNRALKKSGKVLINANDQKSLSLKGLSITEGDSFYLIVCNLDSAISSRYTISTK